MTINIHSSIYWLATSGLSTCFGVQIQTGLFADLENWTGLHAVRNFTPPNPSISLPAKFVTGTPP